VAPAVTRRLCLAALLAVALTAACNAPVAPLPPPTPTAQPPVIGHWNLVGSMTGEHLWIEADGTFTEAGGPPFLAGGTLSWELSAGTWTFADPHLTLDDQTTGAHVFGVVVQQFGAVMNLSDTHSYVFERESVDGGTDHQP
jgi:hypothetical protein